MKHEGIKVSLFQNNAGPRMTTKNFQIDFQRVSVSRVKKTGAHIAYRTSKGCGSGHTIAASRQRRSARGGETNKRDQQHPVERPPVLVAQWITRATSNRKIQGSNPC
jgi:hypothetical protein